MQDKNEIDIAENASRIETISVQSRIPTFWRDKPRLWFAQFEAILLGQKLSDEQKYSLVVRNLEKTDVEQISDIIMSPPSSKRYDEVKKRLLSVYEESETKQLQKLLNEMELGDQKPSQLLRRMKDLARDKIPDPTLQMLWCGHLPSSTRAVLSVSNETDINILAAMADKMQEQNKEVNSICECHSSTSKQDSYQDLRNMIEDLTNEINELKIRQSRSWNRTPPPRRQDQYRSRSRTLSRSRQHKSNGEHESSSSSTRTGLCYFHARFGGTAWKCRQPCNYRSTEN